MCLQVTSRPKRKSGVGWKVFANYSGAGLAGPCYGSHYKVNKWTKSKAGPGFHIYLDEVRPYHPNTFHIRRVAYREATGQGQSNTCLDKYAPCIVAKWMKILPKRKRSKR